MLALNRLGGSNKNRSKSSRQQPMFKPSVSGTWSGPLASELFGDAGSRRLKAGDTLFHEGDTGDGCYRLDKGLLKVRLTSLKGEERIIAIIRSGAIVGDLALIDGLPRAASIVAVTDCELRFGSQVPSSTLPESTQKSMNILRGCWPVACGTPTLSSHSSLSCR